MSINLIFQGVTDKCHADAVNRLLSLNESERVILSVAFLTKRGLHLIRPALDSISDHVEVIVGIRNGITSAQGILACIEAGCSVYVVDTGSRNILFHPKIYYAKNSEKAMMIIGSANTTIGGLITSIEASVVTELDLSEKENLQLANKTEEIFDNLKTGYPENVFEVSDFETVQSLLDSGRVIDESHSRAPAAETSSRNRDSDTTPKMGLASRPTPRIHVDPIQASSEGGESGGEPAEGEAAGTGVAPLPARDQFVLVWESNPLTRRYLTIPTGPNTKRTGSMLFTKGTAEDIDQRHWFRDDVFKGLNWRPDPNPEKSHLERAEAQFQIIIRGVSYGSYSLRLSHNTRTDTVSYRQKNSMTQLHWGDARIIIAREDLLERILKLYRNVSDSTVFVIEID